jgi:predicted  nucleic acid-binding Zn-ribbon protein
MHRLYCITPEKQYDITPLVGKISWQSHVDELGVKLDFTVAFNDDRFFPINPVDLAYLIVLRNQDEIFRGVVVTEQRNGRGEISYTCFDYAFYLNKSKEIYQFNGIPVDQAIRKILSDFNVPAGSIVGIPYPIKKIYNGEVVSDIIKDILSQAEKALGTKYRMEMRLGKLYIEHQQDLVVKPMFQLAPNIAPVPVTAVISNPSRMRSIEEMRNSIKITCNDKVVAEIRDEGLIARYGLLQEVQSIDEKEQGQARQIAANLLKDLGRVFEEISIEVPGADEVRAGRIIEVEEPITGLKGQYLIKDVTHTVEKGIHTMQLGLGVV